MPQRWDNADERGQNRSHNAPKRIAGVIDRLVASLGISRRYYGWQIVANWEQIAGEQVARVSKAVRFEDGVLYVAVAGDAWRQELAMQTDTIMANIHRYPYGDVVTQLRFVRGEKGT